jgi:hypothetical protein
LARRRWDAGDFANPGIVADGASSRRSVRLTTRKRMVTFASRCWPRPKSCAHEPVAGARGYRLWADDYDAETVIKSSSRMQPWRVSVCRQAGCTLLDVGCGTCRRLRDPRC